MKTPAATLLACLFIAGSPSSSFAQSEKKSQPARREHGEEPIELRGFLWEPNN